MVSVILSLVAAIPFVLLFLLLVVRRWGSLKAMTVVWCVTLFSAFFIWKVQPVFLAASFLKGLFLAVEIILIILGAIWIIELLKTKNQIKNIQSLLSIISDDVRVQAIIIAWFFGSLIEGIAGFGTPAALTAPLLVSLGFAPVLAVVVALIANSTAVSFGAAGTPILIGLGGLGFERQTLLEITQTTALLHVIGGIVVPLAISWLVVKHYGKKKDFLKIIPFAIFSWLVFVVPYFLIARFVGPELPSIVTGLGGLIIMSIAAHCGFLVPKKKIVLRKATKEKKITKERIFAFAPYLIIVFFLLVSRTVPFLRTYLSGVELKLDILATGVSYSFSPLYAPSFYFLVSAFAVILIFKANKKEAGESFVKTLKKVKLPFLSLIFALALVQLFLVSGENTSGLESMPLILAKSAGVPLGKVFVVASPIIGDFGSFIAGSNTVSNLLFGAFQTETANALGFSLIAILALQVVGGAIGNMIAIHNVIAAGSTVGVYGKTGEIIRKTILVSLIYALIVGIAALIFLV